MYDKSKLEKTKEGIKEAKDKNINLVVEA